MKEPQSLEEWSAFSLGANVLPWLKGGVYRKIKRSIFFFMLNNELKRAAQRPSLTRATRLMLRGIQKPLHWRMKHHFFELPFELWLMKARDRLVIRRSLLTGQALGHSLGEAR